MLSVLAVTSCGWITSSAQMVDAEVPGDHFSLEGALELFKKSESPEQFESLLNSPDSKVNNLDLNGDGYIDYIRVIDRQDRNVHVFILQALVSESQSQDVAVIELEKLANGKAVLQIIGDEDIYGVETIIEPTREVRTYAGAMTTRTVVNVWSWPVVYHVYSPYYTVWHSPWGWYSRPMWWAPWRPVVFVHYYDYWHPYRSYYSGCHSHRIAYAHEIYYPHRATSIVVRERHYAQLDHYRSNHRGNGRTRTGESQMGNNSGRSSDDDHQGNIAGRDRLRYQNNNPMRRVASDEYLNHRDKSTEVKTRSDFQSGRSTDSSIRTVKAQHGNSQNNAVFERETVLDSDIARERINQSEANNPVRKVTGSQNERFQNPNSAIGRQRDTHRDVNTFQGSRSNEQRAIIRTEVPSRNSSRQQINTVKPSTRKLKE
jgi:hypothetical protein